MTQNNPIRKLRTATGLSQAKCASIVGISNQHWSQVECGTKPASENLARKIAAFLEVPVESLNLPTKERRYSDTVRISLSVQEPILAQIDRLRGARNRPQWIYQAINEKLYRDLTRPDPGRGAGEDSVEDGTTG